MKGALSSLRSPFAALENTLSVALNPAGGGAVLVSAHLKCGLASLDEFKRGGWKGGWRRHIDFRRIAFPVCGPPEHGEAATRELSFAECGGLIV